MNITSTAYDRRPRVGMRVWLALAFGTLGGLLCVVLSFAIGERARDLTRLEIGRYLERMAIEYRNKLDDSLSEGLGDLQLLARLDASDTSLQARRARMEEVMRSRGFTWVGYVDSAGRVHTASDGSYEGSDVSNRPWFRTGLTRKTLIQVSAEARHFIDLAAPLQASGGVVAARVDLSWARRIRAAIEESADPGLPVELMLLGRDGTVLIGQAALLGARVAAPAVSAVQRWPDGQRYIVAASQGRTAEESASLGWAVVARTRADLAFGSVSQLQRAILWAGLILALAGIAAGWFLASRHARPLDALTRAAQEIASGKDRAELPPLDDNKEVSRLADALRTMVSRMRAQAESLRDAQDRLQLRVHERTAELVKAQAELQMEVADAKLAHEQLALALEASGIAVWDYNVPADRIFLSAQWSRMLGGPEVEAVMPSQALIDLAPQAERETVREAWRAALEAEGADFRLEYCVARRDGIVLRVASHGRIVERDADGRARRILGTLQGEKT